MNGQESKDLNVMLEKMEQADKDRTLMHQDIKFIKENLFNPHEGLWAEAKKNTQFRKGRFYRVIFQTSIRFIYIKLHNK